MKKLPMSAASLERFVNEFLPQGKLHYNKSLELMSITTLIETFFYSVDQPTGIQQIFEVFYKLHYPMSVIEPIKDTNTLQPYIDTNSHRIYVAIDLNKQHDIAKLSKILVGEKPIIPRELKSTYNAYQQFMKTVPSANSAR